MGNSAFNQTSGAVGDATFITKTSETASFPNSFNLGGLTTGALFSTVSAGVATPSISAPLTSIHGLTTAADKVIYTTASNTYATTDFTSVARTLVAATTQLAQAQAILNNVGVTAGTVASADKILGLDADDSGNLKSFTAASIAALAGSTAGGLVPLAVATPSGAATVDFDNYINGTYINYYIYYNFTVATDSVRLYGYIGTGGTPTYQSGAGAYKWCAMTSSEASLVGTYSTSDTKLDLIGSGLNIGNATGEGISGILKIQDPTATYGCQKIQNNAAFMKASAEMCTVQFGGQYTSATAITSFRFQASSGNMSGFAILFGVKSTA